MDTHACTHVYQLPRQKTIFKNQVQVMWIHIHECNYIAAASIVNIIATVSGIAVIIVVVSNITVAAVIILL